MEAVKSDRENINKIKIKGRSHREERKYTLGVT